MSKLGIGLLGAARITNRAIVFPAHTIPQTHLVVIGARDHARALEHASKWGVAQAVASYEDVITHPDVQLVYNPLPINLHKEWTIKALEAGKHVLCEKPFAMNSDEAKQMQAAAKASGKRLIEAFHYRYHPAFQTCLDWVNAGEIGQIETMTGCFNVPVRDTGHEIRHEVETGGGAMMDLGCYPLSWMLTLMNAAPDRVEAKATLTPKGVDETLEAHLGFANGAQAEIKTSMALSEPVRADLHIRGTHGDIHFVNPVAPHNGAKLTCQGKSGSQSALTSPISTFTWQLASLMQHLESGVELPTEGAVILRQQETLDAIYDAAGLRHLRWRP